MADDRQSCLLTVIYKTQNDYPVGPSPPASSDTLCGPLVSQVLGKFLAIILGLSYGKMLNVLYAGLTRRLLISRYEW